MPAYTDPVEKAARMARIVTARRARMTWDAIATREGLSTTRCHQLYSEALANHPLSAAAVDEHRVEELELVDAAIRNLMRIAVDKSDETSQRTRVEAWSAIRGWAERKAKLLGLDAPSRHEVVTLDHLDAQIAALEAELAGGSAAAEAAPAP